jgi:hypothetical protein
VTRRARERRNTAEFENPLRMARIGIPTPGVNREDRRVARPAGRIRLGSVEHLRLFCLELLETHDPYKPSVIDWPRLDTDTRSRITSLPIWDIAVQTEGRAGLNVKTFGERRCAGLLKEAVDMNAFEETRHKQVLANMVEFYGVPLQPEPEYKVPRDAEWAFMVTGSKQLGVNITFKGLAEICLMENNRRLAPYDARLIRPVFVPAMIRLVLRFMRDEPETA